MDLRKEFIERLARDERLVDLCREYGISRKTGDKFRRRFEQLGLAGLKDQSRAPRVIPHKTPPEVEEVIVAERKQHPSWGPKKIKAVLELRLGHAFPSAAAFGAILARNGVVQPRKKRRRHSPPHGRRRSLRFAAWAVHGVDHDHGVVPDHERGHDHGWSNTITAASTIT